MRVAKRGAGGRRGGGGRTGRGRGKSSARDGRGRAKDGARRGGRSAPRAGGTRPSRPRRGLPPGEREGLVVATEQPEASGQRLEVEDGEGHRWQVECLGDAVEVGVRVRFAELPGQGPSASKGQLLRVLDRDRESWVVRVLRPGRGQGLVLVPFSDVEVPPLSLAERDARGAEDGDRVVVAPLRRDARTGAHARGRRHRGAPRSDGLAVRVIKILGQAGEPDADHAAVVWKHRLATKFSRRARLEAESLDPTPDAAEQRNRVDLRHLPFVTIDPATARDHDDAVYAEVRPATPDLQVVEAGSTRAPRAGRTTPWTDRLWVAIADVAHFVPEGGFLDADARRRGNSFYFPDRALPMLPERLSSDLCSLRPDVDRRAMVVELRLDARGQVLDALFHEAWIRSRARLSYEEAAAFAAAEDGAALDAQAWGPSLRALQRITGALARERAASGSIELDLPEVAIEIDEAGRPVDARIRERNPAHGWIEESMLAANRAVARVLDRAERATIHRVHPPPSPVRLADLSRLLERHGIDAGDDLDEPGVLARALRAARGLRAEERIHMAALRAMSQARYSTDAGGHYALRFDHYLHFTSPIRRYADLEVHRALRRWMRGERDGAAAAEAERERLARTALWLSGRERVAQEAERDARALASCALMAGRGGERIAARVTSVTEFGLFVRLDSPAVEGLVPLRGLDGEWSFDEDADALVSRGGDRRIEVGDAMTVKLVEVDVDRARLAFGAVGRVGARQRDGRDRDEDDEAVARRPRRGARRPGRST